MNERLVILRKIVEESSKREITMAYLDEDGTLTCVALPIDAAAEPTSDDWVLLMEKAEIESFRVFEVLSIDNNGNTIIPDIPEAPVIAPDDNKLLAALKIADGKREYYLSTVEEAQNNAAKA